MLNIDIYEALESDAPILQFLQQDQTSQLSVEKYKKLQSRIIKVT